MNWHHVRRVVSALAAQLAGLKAMWEEHDLILSAVVDGDAEAAERLARQHAQATMKQNRSSVSAAPAEAGQD